MKKYLLVLLLSTFAYADTIGGEVSLGTFFHTIEGDNSYQSATPVYFSGAYASVVWDF